MGVVIKKLPHPYKLTHKITSKNGKGFFFFGGWRVSQREGEGREEREFFSQIF